MTPTAVITKQKRVLLVANCDAFVQQMARWALVLKKQGHWEPVLYLAADFMERHVAACRAAGICVLSASTARAASDAPGAPGAPDAEPPRSATRLARGAVRALARAGRQRLAAVPFRRQLSYAAVPLRSGLGVFADVRQMRRGIRRFTALLREQRIAVVVMSESGPAYGAPVRLKGAHLAGIPVVTQPIEKASIRIYAENYLHDPTLRVQGALNRALAARYPRWRLQHEGVGLLRVRARLALALEWAGIAPTNPWLLIGNQEEVAAVDSRSTLEHFLREGVPAAKMTVVGRAEHDMMFEAQRDRDRLRVELYARLGLPPDRPMILSPLVPDHYGAGRPECDFQDYSQLVEFWAKSLGGVSTHNAVISLHPGHTYMQDSNAWKFIERWGVRISSEDLASLVPLCDIFVCCGYSTTAQWAIAAAKPVVNYDVFRFGFPMYRETPGVLDMQEVPEFIAGLHRISTDREYYEKMARLQAQSAPLWGAVDGRAGERFAQLFNRLDASAGDHLRATA